MSGFGPARPVGASVADDTNGDADDGGDRWAIDRRRDGEQWTELQRYSSKELAQQALDELAATGEVALEDLRLRHVEE